MFSIYKMLFFEKGLNGQNHSLLDSRQLIEKSPVWNSRASFYLNIIEKKGMYQPLFISVLPTGDNEIMK